MIAARDCGSARYGSLAAAAGLVIVSLMAAYVTLDGTASDFPADQGAVTVLIGTTVLVTAIAFLSSQFMSIATLIGINVYQAYRPEKDEGSIVLVGRTAGTVVVFAAILAGATVGVAGIQRVDWLVRALAAGVPPVAAIVLIGALWNRMHGRGALWALLTGWGVGVVQSVLIAESVASVVIGMIATFVVSALVLVAVSTVVSGEGVLQNIPETLVTKGLQSRKS
jgi:Na+/proline symporter